MSNWHDELRGKLHPAELAAIKAFIVPERRSRWLAQLADPSKRGIQLDKLNHCEDLQEQFALKLPKGENIETVLKSKGAPAKCYIISGHDAIDGLELPLGEAIERMCEGGWGTLLVCVSNRLVFYRDELGYREFILER